MSTATDQLACYSLLKLEWWVGLIVWATTGLEKEVVVRHISATYFKRYQFESLV
jgi:hypothetical protein